MCALLYDLGPLPFLFTLLELAWRHIGHRRFLSGPLWMSSPCTNVFHMTWHLRLSIFTCTAIVHIGIFGSVSFLLQHNYFIFDQVYYLQCRGASMRANLYMGWWEELFLFSHSNPCTEAIKWYGRFIDDLILVWDSSIADLSLFVSYVNDNHLNL